MSEADDQELNQLLSQLDAGDVEEADLPKPTTEALRPIEEPVVEVQPADSAETPSVDVLRYLDKMEGVAEEVLQACRSDRQEAQEVIDMLRQQCSLAQNKNQSPARMYVDGLVKAVEVKANINTNAVKVMEGVAKMIAATKVGSLNINNNNVTVSGSELDEILKNPINGELD